MKLMGVVNLKIVCDVNFRYTERFVIFVINIISICIICIKI